MFNTLGIFLLAVVFAAIIAIRFGTALAIPGWATYASGLTLVFAAQLLAISFSLVLMAFVVDRLFTNKLAVHSYSMSWSANGVAPWGDVETDEKGEPPVVIYRRVNQGYCYDAIFSPELRARLTASNKPVITVQYNVFSDFGHERGYNVRAVDGLVFNHGYRPLRSGERYGGYVMNGSGSGDCQR